MLLFCLAEIFLQLCFKQDCDFSYFDRNDLFIEEIFDFLFQAWKF